MTKSMVTILFKTHVDIGPISADGFAVCLRYYFLLVSSPGVTDQNHKTYQQTFVGYMPGGYVFALGESYPCMIL